MTVTRERFMQGMTYDQFKAQMTRNEQRFETTEQEVVIDPAAVALVRDLSQPVNVLVIAEDWCGDVVDNLPILGRIAQQSDKLTLRVFLRDQNLDLIDQYLKQGQFRAIPVFVFFDEQFNELGRFTERPDSVTERRQQRRQEIFAQHPEFGSPDAPVDQLPEEVRVQLSQVLATMRAELKPLEQREVVQELTALLQRAQG